MSFREIPIEKPELRALGAKLGAERIGKIVRGFYDLMSGDLLIGFFFDGKDLDLISRGQTAFLLRAMGLSPSYSGKAPADAHTAMPPILEGHFDRRLKLLDQHLEAEGLPSSDRQIWIGFENAFRSAILKK